VEWLVVRDEGVSFLGGTAGVRGSDETFTFWATIQDGGSGGPDQLLLRMWPYVADPDSDPPTYQASGGVGGQIQIET
jgi:hypothetical protein